MAYGTPAEPKRAAAAPLVEVVDAELVVEDATLAVDEARLVEEPTTVELPPVDTVELGGEQKDVSVGSCMPYAKSSQVDGRRMQKLETPMEVILTTGKRQTCSGSGCR